VFDIIVAFAEEGLSHLILDTKHSILCVFWGFFIALDWLAQMIVG